MKGRLVLQEREGRVAGAQVETLTLDRRGETVSLRVEKARWMGSDAGERAKRARRACASSLLFFSQRWEKAWSSAEGEVRRECWRSEGRGEGMK